MSETRETFASALHREMPTRLRRWRGDDGISDDIDERLEIELGERRSQDFAEGFADACPVDGCHPDDYRQQILQIGNGQQLLTGIRFHHFLEFPFVDIVASTEPLDDAESMSAALDAILDAYDAFEPERIRVLRSTDRPVPIPDGLEATVDQYIVVGPIEQLSEQPPTEHEEPVRLEPVDDIDRAVGFVQEAYEQFFAEHPQFKSRIVPADNERLGRARQTGELCYVQVDGTRAGLLASRDKLGPLVRGQTIVEEILTAEYRGRGIAPVAQRMLIDRLADSHFGGLVRGTIDATNAASRATARRVGRHEAAAWYWLNW